MKKLILLSLFLIGCADEGNQQCLESSVTTDDHRMDVLVIGDSVSIGYTPFIQRHLSDYDIVHTPCNSRWSTNGVNRIDYWLAMRPSWAAITFNHGLWDLQRSGGVDIDQYEANLITIATKIKAATPNPVFILTTAIPVNADGKFCRECEIDYQNRAIQVMNNLNIPIIDLYTVSKNITEHHINNERQNDVHFNSIGYSILAYIINQYLTGVL